MTKVSLAARFITEYRLMCNIIFTKFNTKTILAKTEIKHRNLFSLTLLEVHATHRNASSAILHKPKNKTVFKGRLQVEPQILRIFCIAYKRMKDVATTCVLRTVNTKCVNTLAKIIAAEKTPLRTVRWSLQRSPDPKLDLTRGGKRREERRRDGGKGRTQAKILATTL